MKFITITDTDGDQAIINTAQIVAAVVSREGDDPEDTVTKINLMDKLFICTPMSIPQLRQLIREATQ